MRFFLRSISYFRDDWRLIASFLAMVALSVGIGVMQAWPMAVLVDIVLNANRGQPSWPERLFLFGLPHNRLAQVIGVAVIGMCLKGIQDVLGALKIIVNNRFNFNGRLRVRSDLYNKLENLNIAYHRAQPQGDAIYRILNDTIGCDQILNTLLNALIAAVTLAVMISVMISRNIPLTAMALSIAPMLLLTNSYFSKRIKTSSIGMKLSDTHLTTLVQRTMSAVGLVQAFNRQRSEFQQFRIAAVASASSNFDLEKCKALFGLTVQTVYTLGGAIIFGYGGYLVYRDQFVHPKAGGVTLGDLMVFMSYLGSLWMPLQTLTTAKADMQTGVAGAERVFEVLDQPSPIADASGSMSLPIQPRELSLNNVSFEYLPGHSVLSNISARIAPGKMIGFVGPSGAGKSTLLQLIPRFYDVTSGSVQLDGIDVRKIKLTDLRSHIALVPQETLLLPTTVAENIGYGRPDATTKQIQRAATLAGADEFIATLPKGYDTVLTEGGQNLSGGQRQRIAIARAILSEAPILVLDEPTSALDPANTQKFLRTLNELRHHRTIILVTHHVHSVAGCDEIYVLDAGRIVEHGHHRDLLAHDGVYANLLHDEPEIEESSAEIAAKN